MKARSLRNFLFFAAFAVVFVNLGYFLGTKNLTLSLKNAAPYVSITNKNAPANYNVDFSLFWDVWRRLEQKYIDKSKLNPEQMVYGAIKGMTQSLDDPYTVFLPPKENTESKEQLNGEFEGIGAQLGMKEKRIIVVAPLKGMPAEKAGLLPGDWIMKVDDKETMNWSVEETVDKIRGPRGTKVVLSILRASDVAKIEENTNISHAIKPITVEIVRESIKVPSVEVTYQDNIAILKLSQFGDATTEEWQKAVSEIVRTGKAGKLILDLRSNPGGYLQSAVFIASEFLEEGVVVIQENYDGTKEENKVSRQGYLTHIPMIVLVNEGSASASEIVAGALQVRGRAKLVGEKTFGKGSIQEPEDLAGGAGLHITIAKWLLPDGTWINGAGITPDVIIADNYETEVDEQLEEAVEIMSKS